MTSLLPQPAQPAGPGVTGGGWLDFARALLAAIGAPDTPNTEAAMLTWFAGEQPPGSPNAAFNPLNIQASGYPGQADVVGTSGSGQFDFASWADGVAQTADFLSQGSYAGIVQAFQTNAPAESIVNAIEASPWAASHYGGSGLNNDLASVLSNWAQYANGAIAGGGGASGNLGTGGSGAGGSASATGLGSDIVSSLVNPLLTGAERLGLLIVGVMGAVVLVVLGAYRATEEQRAQLNEQAGQAAKLAAVAA